MGNINKAGIAAINRRKIISESDINEIGLTRETKRNSTSKALEIDKLRDKLACNRIANSCDTDDFYDYLEAF